jgi:predicted nucleic-acid-binding Zn-ribbon protein
MKDGICPKCSSKEIMANVKVRDWAYRNPKHPLHVAIDEPEPADKGMFWIGDGASGEVQAWICSQCGYTELYTDNLEKLYETYKKYKLGN